MVEGNGTSAKEDQREGEGGGGQSELISRVVRTSDESVVQMHFPDGHKQIDENGKCRHPREESHKDHQPAEEFREGGDIAEPCGQTETGHHLCMVMQTSKNFVIAMCDHDDAQGQAHRQKRKRLQPIEIAQSVPPNRELDYRSPAAALGKPEMIFNVGTKQIHV
jgi:hypothetical protein